MELLNIADSGNQVSRPQVARAIAEMKSHSQTQAEWQTAFDLQLVDSAMHTLQDKDDVDVITKCLGAAREILNLDKAPEATSKECMAAADVRARNSEERYQKLMKKH